MIDPGTWGQDLHKNNSPSLNNIDRFIASWQMMYGNKDQILNVGRIWFYDIPEYSYNHHGNISAWSTRLRRSWRDAVWDEVQTQPMLYDMVWGGVNDYLQRKLELFTHENGMFNWINKIFDWAAEVEMKPDKYSMQQQKPSGQTCPRAGNSAISGH